MKIVNICLAGSVPPKNVIEVEKFLELIPFIKKGERCLLVQNNLIKICY